MNSVIPVTKRVRKSIDIEVLMESVAEKHEDEILLALSQTKDARTPMEGKELETFEKELARYR
jgi:hypothetical protein